MKKKFWAAVWLAFVWLLPAAALAEDVYQTKVFSVNINSSVFME